MRTRFSSGLAGSAAAGGRAHLGSRNGGPRAERAAGDAAGSEENRAVRSPPCPPRPRTRTAREHRPRRSVDTPGRASGPGPQGASGAARTNPERRQDHVRMRPARTRRAPRADRRGHGVRACSLPPGAQGSRERRGPREEAAEHSGWRRRCSGPALRTGRAGSPSSEGYGRRWGGKPTETGSGRRAGRPWGPVCVAPGPRARAAPGMPTVSWPRSQAPGGPSQALGQSARPHLAAAGPWPVAQATRGKGHVTAQGPRVLGPAADCQSLPLREVSWW